MATPHPIPSNPRFQDLAGRRYHRWLVLFWAGKEGARSMWWCRCDCGAERKVWSGDMRNGSSRSCGCLARETASRVKRTHGMSGHGTRRRGPEYRAWAALCQRCSDPSGASWHNYGGRGIGVCERWRGPGGFVNFLADMGQRPTPGHTVERIDNDGGYEPGNCRWATRQEQMNNTRHNRRLAAAGMTLTVTEWARRLGVPRERIKDRLRLGWSVEEALTLPPGHRRHAGDAPA